LEHLTSKENPVKVLYREFAAANQILAKIALLRDAVQILVRANEHLITGERRSRIELGPVIFKFVDRHHLKLTLGGND